MKPTPKPLTNSLITAGIDMGTQTIKVIILKDKKILAKSLVYSGFDPAAAAKEAFDTALKKAGLTRKDIQYVIATGAGADLAPVHDSKVSMMGADAKAATFLFPTARTIVDVGADEARAVKCDEKGRMISFVVNERCAAGAGTFLEAMARALEVELDQMASLALKAEKASHINANCVIFGESDVISLIHRQEPKAEIARAIYDAIAERITSMTQRLGITPDIVLIGGVAKDKGFTASFKQKLGTDILIPENPEFAGALGAALLAAEKIEDTRK